MFSGFSSKTPLSSKVGVKLGGRQMDELVREEANGHWSLSIKGTFLCLGSIDVGVASTLSEEFGICAECKM